MAACPVRTAGAGSQSRRAIVVLGPGPLGDEITAMDASDGWLGMVIVANANGGVLTGEWLVAVVPFTEER